MHAIETLRIASRPVAQATYAMVVASSGVCLDIGHVERPNGVSVFGKLPRRAFSGDMSYREK